MNNSNCMELSFTEVPHMVDITFVTLEMYCNRPTGKKASLKHMRNSKRGKNRKPHHHNWPNHKWKKKNNFKSKIKFINWSNLKTKIFYKIGMSSMTVLLLQLMLEKLHQSSKEAKVHIFYSIKEKEFLWTNLSFKSLNILRLKFNRKIEK